MCLSRGYVASRHVAIGGASCPPARGGRVDRCCCGTWGSQGATCSPHVNVCDIFLSFDQARLRLVCNCLQDWVLGHKFTCQHPTHAAVEDRPPIPSRSESTPTRVLSCPRAVQDPRVLIQVWDTPAVSPKRGIGSHWVSFAVSSKRNDVQRTRRTRATSMQSCNACTLRRSWRLHCER